VKQRRLGRVQVFRFARAQHAPAEGDHAAAGVADGEHHAAAEAVVTAALLALDQHAGRGEPLHGLRVRTELLEQPVPLVRRPADAEGRGGRAADAARLEVADGLGVVLELLLVEAGRRLEGAVQVGAAVRARRLLARHFQPGERGEFLDRLGEAEVLVVHQEPQRRAVRAAAEAVIELLGRADGERRRLLAVEGAAGLVLAPRLLERHTRIDHLHDIRAAHQFVNEAGRNQAHRQEISVIRGAAVPGVGGAQVAHP
jgi:hypothetical protein